jgi:PIN domain nuclease of toxin-antitoxin system
MRVLLDTNSLIWATADGEQLSAKARDRLDDPASVKVVSAVVFWEMTIKVGLGKLSLGMSPDALMEMLLTQGDIELLDIHARHLRRLLALPHHHRDPFDRLMIAQALEEGWEVISSDDQWDAYGVTRIW